MTPCSRRFSPPGRSSDTAQPSRPHSDSRPASVADGDLLMLLRPVVSEPDDGSAVAAAGQNVAPNHGGIYARPFLRMLLERQNFLALLGVPELGGRILAASEDAGARGIPGIGQVRHGSDRGRMPLEGQNELMRGGIPDLRSVVFAARQHPCSVGREYGAENR